MPGRCDSASAAAECSTRSRPAPASATIAGHADQCRPRPPGSTRRRKAHQRAAVSRAHDDDGCERTIQVRLRCRLATTRCRRRRLASSRASSARDGLALASQARSIHLTQGQQLDTIAMQLPRGGVISGIITDEFGDPALGVPVRAMRLGYANGERLAQPIANATTDDLGGYRLPGLLPGNYIVSAVPRDSVAAQAAMDESLRARQAEIAASGRAAPGSPSTEPLRRQATGYVPVYFGSTVSAGRGDARAGRRRAAGGRDRHPAASDRHRDDQRHRRQSGWLARVGAAATRRSVDADREPRRLVPDRHAGRQVLVLGPGAGHVCAERAGPVARRTPDLAGGDGSCRRGTRRRRRDVEIRRHRFGQHRHRHGQTAGTTSSGCA